VALRFQRALGATRRQYMSEYGAMVGWYWQSKTEWIREKPVLVSLCSPQILHGHTRARTQRQTAWAVAWPTQLHTRASFSETSSRNSVQLTAKDKRVRFLSVFFHWYRRA
jgi:hypothetical protein